MAEPAASGDADRLRALEARIERATRAAERLLAVAQDPEPAPEPADGRDGDVPPRGWQRPSGGEPEPFGGFVDPEDARLLLDLLAEVRERVPPELERRVVLALRELLLALRALLDWCVERTERRAGPPAEVQDIPIL
jgi:hypothetical protein